LLRRSRPHSLRSRLAQSSAWPTRFAQLRHILAGMYLAIHGQAYIFSLRSGMLLGYCSAAPGRGERSPLPANADCNLDHTGPSIYEYLHTTPAPIRVRYRVPTSLRRASVQHLSGCLHLLRRPTTAQMATTEPQPPRRGRLFPHAHQGQPRLPANAMGKCEQSSRLKCGDTVFSKADLRTPPGRRRAPY